jgi:alpha-glucosidase
MTNWEARNLDIDLRFLEGKRYKLEAVQDGINADQHAADHSFHTQAVTPADHVTIQMSKGGGWLAILTKEE